MLKLPICGQVGKKIEAYVNCPIEDIENFDYGAMEDQLKWGAVIIICIKCLEKDEYFQKFSIDNREIGECYCWVGRIEIKR